MLAELQVPNTSPQSLAELRDRAENVRQVAGDFKLEAFISRLSQFNDSGRLLRGHCQPGSKQATASLD